MLKTQMIGHLAHDNKLFSRTCARCGGIYSNEGAVVCPKCNSQLVPITAKNGRAMMVSEGTIYPIMTKDQKDREAQSRAKRQNSMEITYRFVILSFAHPESGIVIEPPVHRYLTKGRQIMIETNHSPIISWFKANDESTKCEVRFGILYNEGDSVRLLGRKESMENLTSPEAAAAQPAVVQNEQHSPVRDAVLAKAIEEATAAIHQAMEMSSAKQTPIEEPIEEPIIIQANDGFDDVEPF